METSAPGKVKPKFNARTESEKLYNAIKGVGTDEQVIIDVLTSANSEQRRELTYTYKALYSQNLVDAIAGDTWHRGNFQKVCIGLLRTPADFDAECVRLALEGPIINEDALIDVICSSDSEEIVALKEAYNKMYKRNLEEDVENGTKGDLQKVLVALLKPSRADKWELVFSVAQADANKLYGEGNAKLGAEDSDFFNIMVNRSHLQLLFTFHDYTELSTRNIVDVIDADLSGSMAKAMTAIALFSMDKINYYAYSLFKSMKGLGTNNAVLIHIIVKTNENKLPAIKEEFLSEYKGSLAEWVADDTSGNYKDILLALIGPDSSEVTKEEAQEKK
ncbi:annexin A13-like [Ptychodera flava]|uniref:annexin A13-like n=1 Tax=Ptychodera flava TaxID=63121 RepID=UPI00396A5B82